MDHSSATSQSHTGFRGIKVAISKQISFWLWDRKLSRKYHDIMAYQLKQKKAAKYSGGTHA
ncbi:MAG: hypothetical protein GY694_17300 [Gammaproteobacteria bacterium]|nr:hypothetical protein [Gammaproteobacteria bacterium]